MKQSRLKKLFGDEMEQVFNGNDGKVYIKHPQWRRRNVLRPERASPITAAQFVKKFRYELKLQPNDFLNIVQFSLIDKRTVGLPEIRISLEEGNGVFGDSGIPIKTNEDRFQDQDQLKTLPIYILLSNGEIVKLKEEKDNIVNININTVEAY